MNINVNGRAIRRDQYGLSSDVLVAGSAVASITFSGLDDVDRLALDVDWLHASTGVERLDLEINGDPAPGGSTMIRNQFEASAGLREDRTDPGFTIADLVGGAAGTSWEGVLYLLTDLSEGDKAVAEVDGHADDSVTILGDRERFVSRRGRWNAIVGEITSISLVVASSNSEIEVGSQVMLFL